MPTTFKFFDTQTTYELKTFEHILSCGKCYPKGQLIATKKVTEDKQTIHVCNNCGREQPIAGPIYPRTETRKIGTDSYIERVEVIPDELPRDYYPEYYTDRDSVSSMSWPQQLDLLRSTQKPVMVDLLEYATSESLHRFTDMRRELFDMAREAATHRGKTMPADPNDIQLESSAVWDMSMVNKAKVLGSTRWPTNVTHIQGATEGGILYKPEIRKPLYAAARYVVSMRGQEAKPESNQPAKNKGGRPRKNLVDA